jgi:hypothetical protein
MEVNMKGLLSIMAVTVLGLSPLKAAKACDFTEARDKATAMALAMEKINGGVPLTHDTYSTSSGKSTFIVLASDSGIQNTWVVTFDSDFCRMTGVALE